MSRVLSEHEMEFIENNQDIMRDAGNLLVTLSQVRISKDATVRLGTGNKQ